MSLDMRSQIWYFVLFIFCCCSLTTNGYPNIQLDSSTLKTVNLFFRHGARTPLVSTPPKAKFDILVWEEEPGELTKVGKEKMFELGLELRKMYDDFLNPYYFPGEIQVSSTPVDRTINSAKALLAGLYNLNGYRNWSEAIPPTAVPILTDDHMIDKSNVINSPSGCPSFKTEQRLSVSKAINDDTNFSDIYDYLSLYAGSKVTGLFDIFPVWDILECLSHNNLQLPDWASFVYPERLSSITAKVLRSIIAGTKKMIRLTAGPYVQEIHQQFNEAVQNKTTAKKLVVHAGHDFSMTANLGALGVFEKIVNPGDALLLELHEIPFAGYVVQLRYAESGGSSVTIVPIKNCGQICPLHKFLLLTKDLIPVNWQMECLI